MLPDIKKIARDVADAHGAKVEMVHYEPLYKNMINDPRMDVYFADAFNQLYEEFGVRDDDYAEGSTDVAMSAKLRGSASRKSASATTSMPIRKNLPKPLAATWARCRH